MKIRVTEPVKYSEGVVSVIDYDLDLLEAKLIVDDKEYQLKELLGILIGEYEKMNGKHPDLK